MSEKGSTLSVSVLRPRDHFFCFNFQQSGGFLKKELTLKMTYLPAPGAELFYETHGVTGPWVTMINGHTRSSSDFRIFASKLLKKGFRCLLLDNRGSGETRAQGTFDILQMAEDVRRLWSHLQIDASCLLGISMGGLIAQVLAASEESVTALALISTYSDKKFVSASDLPWEGGETAVMLKLQKYFAPAFLERNQLLIQTMARQISKKVSAGAYLEGAKSQVAAMRSFDFSSLGLEQIRCPTLILHGEDDQIIWKGSALEIAERISHAHVKIYSASGHLLLAERGQELYQDVIEFFTAPKRDVK